MSWSDAPKITSVLVMRGDAIAYEQYFNGATAATLHNTRSATKSLTALAVGIAIDRHALPGSTCRRSRISPIYSRSGPQVRSRTRSRSRTS